jgi:dipeptide transport system ATP-binding protein
VVRHIATEVMVMYCGRPVEHGPKASIFEAPLHPYTRMLLAATPSVDPRHRKQSVVIKGELPSPLNPPPGCAFASRCPHATARCIAERPTPRSFGGHSVACHNLEAISATA